MAKTEQKPLTVYHQRRGVDGTARGCFSGRMTAEEWEAFRVTVEPPDTTWCCGDDTEETRGLNP